MLDFRRRSQSAVDVWTSQTSPPGSIGLIAWLDGLFASTAEDLADIPEQ